MAAITLQEFGEDNIDDLIRICSPLDPESGELRTGIAIRREWLMSMFSKYGSIAKIAYIEDDPVAEIMFYPEKADPSVWGRRDYSVYLHCLYNPNKATQRLGVGRSLMDALIKQCTIGTGSCRGCKLIAADGFDTGIGLSLIDFYRRFGFTEISGEDGQALWGGTSMHLVLSQPVQSRPHLPFVSLQEDRGHAVVFYSPACQFSYQFAAKTAHMISETEPELKVNLINRWQQPDEYLKRGARWAIVDGREVTSSPMDGAAFRKEIRKILRKQT